MASHWDSRHRKSLHFHCEHGEFANGTHTLTASLRTPRISRELEPRFSYFLQFQSGEPRPIRMWSGIVPLPIVSVHLVLLPDGKILM